MLVRLLLLLLSHTQRALVVEYMLRERPERLRCEGGTGEAMAGQDAAGRHGDDDYAGWDAECGDVFFVEASGGCVRDREDLSSWPSDVVAIAADGLGCRCLLGADGKLDGLGGGSRDGRRGRREGECVVVALRSSTIEGLGCCASVRKGRERRSGAVAGARAYSPEFLRVSQSRLPE